MKRVIIFAAALVLLMAAGCAAKKAEEDSVARMEEDMRESYCSMEQASPNIGSRLADLAESGKPLEKFSAYLTDLRENEDQTIALTIDRIAFDEGYEDASLRERPSVIKDEDGQETVTVRREVCTIVDAANFVSLDERVLQYARENQSYFDFYVCDGAVLFLAEGMSS